MPYNPGNVRKLNALGGKRPQATGIVLLPKNGGNILATSEGSVNNYGGNTKMGLYSNVGMSYLFQNTQLTGQRLNGNMPYFWGSGAITKNSKKETNMVTVNALEDGTTLGFVSSPYWGPISTAFAPSSLVDSHMGVVNGKEKLEINGVKVIALEKWRTSASGPSDNDVYLWLERDIPSLTAVTFKSEGISVTVKVTDRYNASNAATSTPPAPQVVQDAFSDLTFPDSTGVVSLTTAESIPATTVALRLSVDSGTPDFNNLNAIFPTSSIGAGNRKVIAVVFH